MVDESVLGWVFGLRSWQEQQGMDGGEDSVDSRVWAAEFARFGAQVVGRTVFDFGYQSWGENPPFRAPVFALTHRGGVRIEKQGGTSYTSPRGSMAPCAGRSPLCELPGIRHFQVRL